MSFRVTPFDHTNDLDEILLHENKRWNYDTIRALEKGNRGDGRQPPLLPHHFLEQKKDLFQFKFIDQ